jgi:hypothetical protein
MKSTSHKTGRQIRHIPIRSSNVHPSIFIRTTALLEARHLRMLYEEKERHLQSVPIERRNFRIDRLIPNSGHVPLPVLTYLDNRCKSDSATDSYRSQSAG